MTDFYKYHALGNDYIVIDPSKVSFPIKLTEDNIKLICHRNLGIGSDGILYGPIMRDGKMHFQIFNPDGSEAEKSGNGIRIFAQYVWDIGYSDAKEITLETKGGTVIVESLDKEKNLMKVNMGNFYFPDNIINKELAIADQVFFITCVNIGNPHCVIICDDISPEETCKYGPLIEVHPMFPNRTNVQFVKVIDKRNIQIEIWERGAGYTSASGSSSTAAAIAAHKHGLVGADLTVSMPGGSVEINIEDNHAYLTGPVSRVMTGSIASDLKKFLIKTP